MIYNDIFVAAHRRVCASRRTKHNRYQAAWFFFITIERHTFLFYLAHRGVGGLFVVGAVVVIARRLRLDGWPNIYKLSQIL